MRPWLFFLGNPRTEDTAPSVTYAEIVDECVLADRLGYFGAWVGEHHWIPNNAVVPNPLLLCAAIAQATARLRIGPGCIVLPLHNPHRVAEDVAMVDAISNGRLDVVLCRGDHPHEYRALGVSIADSRRLYEEGLDLVLGYLEAGGERAPRPLVPALTQRPHPPLWMTCGSPDSVRAALRRGMRVVIPGGLSAHGAALRAAFVAECEARGLDPSKEPFGVLTHAALAERPEEIENAVELGAFFQRTVSRMRRGCDAYLDAEDLAAPFDRQAWLDAHPVGDQERLRIQLARFAELGVTDLFLQFARGRLQAEHIKRSMRIFASLLVAGSNASDVGASSERQIAE